MIPISVVIPCYNVENYIIECLDSILHQSYEPEEIIIVDNNCTDKTIEIAENHLHGSTIKSLFIKETKQGAPYARNKGYKMASSNWIQFLDADDTLLKDKLLTHDFCLHYHPFGKVVG